MTPLSIIEVILGSLLSLIFSLLLWLLKDKVKQMETELSNTKLLLRENQDKMYNFEHNYIDRFEELNKSIFESKLEIIQKIHQLELINKHK